ncbi:MAG TPA: ornithine cyclodeaminase family protein [Chitinophagaceae bacterium]|nr:ornithine cyclodeaminase family protein [Chitinophagaceae bacterium]
MEKPETLLLTRRDVANLLTITECMDAVENAFGLYANGKMMAPKVLGIHVDNGGFHIKAGVLESDKTYFAAKSNANFPNNSIQYGLPTIQGVIIVCDGRNGRLLSLIDSIEITILRTGAATGIAAKYLALPDARVATICGCGNQGKISLKALMEVRKLELIYAFDIDPLQAEKLTQEFSNEIKVISITANDLHNALIQSHICVTCTPSKKPFIHAEDIMPGTFIAAVGSDSEEKQELFSDLIAKNKIVVDMAEQSATIGELHHAIKQGLTTVDSIHAELGQIITGQKPGRESDKEIIIFDSTGTALQDVASATIVYEKALINKIGTSLNFSDT